jgi:ADP-ribose pyrophosphatase YjhB (NUDIX family)
MENNENILEFGIKRENEERRDGGCSIVFDPETQKYAVYRNPKSKVLCFFGGGFDDGEDEKDGSLRELVEESGLVDYLHVEKVGKVITHYYNINKNVNRVAHASCFLVILNSKKREETKLEEHENDFEFIWATDEEILDSLNSKNQNRDYDHWVHFLEKAVIRVKELGHNTAIATKSVL